ncbi:hypothetical protein PSECIP111951_02423 [Pseudoalteromonas holothuriae]|uniref:N-acetyltransferase domain-containing protein n=1 Tax=Pseudoalteromonas holothuriae TaxID=2963714 RepID=A0ABM9GJ68_9GAMM|nr:GNAT family N-acetyltransferase [Pseudoalteromonas sp. CIP111951]CAH9061130.1 hypothetical protein PSECIP111951_02423 [Pseudoalteromonas sp. CIP111951]
MQNIITTERLALRAFELTDAAQVAKLAGDKRVSEMTKNIPHPYSEQMAIDWIATHDALFKSGKGVNYAITKQGDDNVIGTVSFVEFSNGVGTLGYWLGFEYWGQGFMPEAVNALVHHYQHKLKGLAATHFTENTRSRKVIEKLGLYYVEDTMIEICGEQRDISVHQVAF